MAEQLRIRWPVWSPTAEETREGWHLRPNVQFREGLSDMAKDKAKGGGAAQPLLPQATDSEVEAYHFIRENLAEVGWVVKDPSRLTGGEVWTQGQCLAHPEIKKQLGQTKPENVVKLTETQVWVIEAKSKVTMMAQALKEAEHDYARKITAGGKLAVPLISGVAGNDAGGYEIRTRLLVKGVYEPVTINGVEATGLLDPATVRILLDTGKPDVADFTVNEGAFLHSAERINETLHNGGINKNERAKVMAALLLAMVDGSHINLDSDLAVLIDDINARTRSMLGRHRKKELHPYVEIDSPASPESFPKYKAAIVRTIQELANLNIKSAMNSGTDVLGKFYEVFLRYGNGAKEIGIVLTPRHITRFAVAVAGVSATDIVFDPACGTGGFLVAAFDHVRAGLQPNSEDLDRFKQHNLFGIEQESYVAALAVVNMIFRGDGKNGVIVSDGLSKFLRREIVGGQASAVPVDAAPAKGQEPVTRVFMNPPFALKKNDEREWSFVEAALKSMATGGLLVTVVPMSVVSEGGQAGGWRRPLLSHHTLLSVVSLPEDLFYPVSVQAVIVILRKGVPHPTGQAVLWARVTNDGFRKVKSKRLPVRSTDPTDLDKLKPILQGFLINPTQTIATVPEFVRAASLDMADPILEFAPEAYLTSHIPKASALMERLDRQVRENLAALVEFDLTQPLNATPSGRPSVLDGARSASSSSVAPPRLNASKFKPVPLDSLFDLQAGNYHALTDEESGATPVVSCADTSNGIAGWYDIPPGNIYRDAPTIAFNGWPLTTKLHPYPFAAKDDVAVAIPKTGLAPETLIFIQAQLNSERWRFSYYRKCFRAKLGRTTIELPMKSGEIDEDFMVAAVRAQNYWWALAPRLANWTPQIPTSLDE